MRESIIRGLDSPFAVRAAMIVTLLFGYFFVFVWAPHPWSWQGIDAYHALATSLARGESFQTTDVPWGYAYYAALFYWLFNDRIWVPLVVQATLNALVPWMLYRLVAPLAGRRVAALSALVTGVFSFNTIYSSTQSSDTVCTVLLLAALIFLARGIRESSLWPFAISGMLFGLVPQFRPNLVMLPGVIVAACLWWQPRTTRTVVQVSLFALLVVALQLPWIVRNYRLTGMFLPTSTHGGVQLWYGTLQVGPYLESRAHNPRFYFASPAFTYTSMYWRPLHVQSLRIECFADPAIMTQLVFWTDRDAAHRRVPAVRGPGDRVTYTIPAQPNQTVVYYYFEQSRPAGPAWPPQTFTTPFEGARNPLIAFVSDDHLGDLDRHDEVFDLFDVIRLLRHLAWSEPLRAAERLDLDRDGRNDSRDLELWVATIMPERKGRVPEPLSRVETAPDRVTIHLADGSWLAVPRDFRGRQTDVELSLHGEMAPALLSRNRTFTALSHPPRRPGAGECVTADELEFNGPFYLGEPHGMRRYMALAFDNIERDPGAFVAASLYRFMRLFIVRGSSDVSITQQFTSSALVFAAGTALSLAYLAVFLAGVVISHRRRSALRLLLIPIVYVPLTICFVLTNMRYTVTVQPLMFAFVAVAAAAALKLDDAG